MLYKRIKVVFGNLNEDKLITLPMLKNFTKDNPYLMDVKIFYFNPRLQ